MLTGRLMIQAIADCLAGLETDLPLDDFTEPLRSAYEAVRAAPQEGRQGALLRSLLDCPDRDRLIGGILSAAPGDGPDYPSLADIADALPAIEWLWPGWIPSGMITLLGSAPGVGKSMLSLDLARRVIHGMDFPDGSVVSRPGSVIYVDAELVPQLINERAERWKMDTSALYLLQPAEFFIDFGEQRDRDRLAEMAYTIDPVLIIIDSLSSISSRGENSVKEVRGLLSFLNNLALDMQAGLLLIHHLRKGSNSLNIDSFRGSSHIVAMSRSVLGLSMVQTGPEPDRNGPRQLELIKTNLGRYPDPIGVELLPLHPDGVLIEYVDPPRAYEPPTQTTLCGEWLVETLEEFGGPMRPRDIVSLAAEDGFSRSTLYRARSDLGDAITNTEGHHNPDNRWELA